MKGSVKQKLLFVEVHDPETFPKAFWWFIYMSLSIIPGKKTCPSAININYFDTVLPAWIP